MESDEGTTAVDNGEQEENVFSNDFTADFDNGWNNENNDNQPPMNQQPPTSIQQQQSTVQNENRFVPNNSNRGNIRGKGHRGGRGSGPNNWNPHQTVPIQQPPTQQMPQELWVETKTGDNKSYFYHAVTRETTWNRPDGPNIKVMTQAEFEAYTRQQMRPMEQQQRPDQMKDPKMTMMPPNLMEHNTHLPPPTQQIPPFMPPFNANVSPFGMHAPPHFNAPFPQWQQPPNDPAKMFDNRIDPKILAKAAEWTEHRAPDGRSYYFSSARGESVWERPQALRELDEARAAFMHQQPPMTSSQGSITFDSAGNMVKPGALMNKPPIEVVDPGEKDRKRKEEIEKAKQQPPKPQDKTRPISSTPIAGTPWCVVWTGDSRVFFYNPSSRTSVWERPQDLVGRADVDKAVGAIPDQLKKDGNVKEETTQVSEKANNPGIKVESEKSSEEEEEDEEIPTKKSKVEEQIAVPVKIQNAPPIVEKKVDVVKDPAVEAELKAAKERAQIPLEVRVKQFKEMLKEKEVSAFSTWEKELHKIVFDQRYLLLASKERKQVFEKYVKDRAEDERREKRFKAQKKRDDFKALMEEANLHSRSNFSDFCSRYSREERYKGIDKMRERENLFTDFLSELRRREKDEKHLKKEQVRKDFFDLLKSHSEIDRHSHWMDIKKKLDQDPRYKAITDSVLREDYFYEYVKMLKDERKKEKTKKAKKSEKKEKKKKSKDKDRHRNESNNSNNDAENKSNDESAKIEKESPEKNNENKPTNMDIDDEDNKSEMEIDKSGSESEKDQEDGEHSGTDEDSETEKARKDKERQQRAEASIKEREKQVQIKLAEHLRDRDKERQHHKHDEAIRNFGALLADLVRNPDLTWKEAKKLLKKDHRYDSDLDRDERERLFNDHINMLAKKKRDKFREMLDEILNMELTSPWKEIKRQIRDDPRYSKFGNSDRCEREFRDYIRDKTANAKSEFKELLQECKLITHKSYDLYKENHNHLKEIEDILKNDKRYLVLEHMPRERTDMILYYFEDLKKKGFPAPITQTIDNNRRKK